MKNVKEVKAQSVSEYSLLLVVVLISMVAMSLYAKRGLQGRHADLVDFTTTRAQAFSQYEPYYQQEDLGITQNTTLSKSSKAGTSLFEAGEVVKGIDQDSFARKGETRDLTNYGDDIAEVAKIE